MSDIALRDVWTAYGMESSFGKDRSTLAYTVKDQAINRQAWNATYKGSFQIGKTVQNEYGLATGELFDKPGTLGKSAEVYKQYVANATKDTGGWSNWGVNEKAETLGLDKGLLEYLTWQEGREGTIEIITAAARPNGSLPSGMRRVLQRNSETSLPKGASDQKYALLYLDQLKNAWDRRKKQSEAYYPLTEEEQVFNNEVKF